jgi:hypothetical protein
MLWWRLKTFFATVAILLVGTAALAKSYEPFLSLFPSTKLGTVSNAAVLYGLLALSYAPLAIAILLFGFALSYAFSFHSRFRSCLFLVLSVFLIAVGAAKYVSQGPYSLAGTAVLDKQTYHLIKASQFPEEKFILSLCECEISSLACQCHEFYTYSSPTVGTDFSLVPDKAAGEMQVWLNGKLLYAYGSLPRCYAQRPLIIDACIDK